MRWAILMAALAAVALILFGVATTPHFFESQKPWLGVFAASGIVLAYAVTAYFALPALSRGSGEVLRVAGMTGLTAGAVYTIEIFAEYIVQPTDNTDWGLVEFGLIFALMALAGGVLAWRTGRWRAALAGGLWTALIGPLVWYVVLLASDVLMRRTAAQHAVFLAEGEYQDFARSGLKDFNVFVMSDHLGAGFYHLLLSPVFGLLLGALGAVPGLLLRRVLRPGAEPRR